MIPQQIIDDVRAATNIVDVISQYVQLRQQGPNWKGLCPFHEEKTPSFNVNEPRQIFHCFGCDEGGNVFSFVQKIENRSFPEVVEELAARAGIEIPKSEEPPEVKKARSEREQLCRANEKARDFFREVYKSDRGKIARSYVAERGFDDEIVDLYQVGYCGPGWDTFAQYVKEHRHPIQVAEKAGLVVKGKRGTYYDRFHDRLVFPITNRSSRVIGFGGRILDREGPKYLNSAETPIYHKQEAVFGLEVARPAIGKADRVLVVEGYFDVMGLAAAGFKEAVATCGTALTSGHIQVLRRFTTTFVLLYDGDAAGRKAAMRSLPLFVEAGLSARVVLLPEEHDPDTYVREHGADGMAQLIEQATPLEKLCVIEAQRRAPKEVAGRLQVAKRLAQVFAKAPDEAAKRSYGSLISTWLDLPDDIVRGMINGDSDALKAVSASEQPNQLIYKGKAFTKGRQPGVWEQGALNKDERLRPMLLERSNPEETLVKLMLVSPDVAANVSTVGILDCFSDHKLRALGQLILEASEHGERPIEAADLLDRVNEEKHRRILEIVASDTEPLIENLEAIVTDCIEKIHDQSLKDQRKQLRAALEEAERAGDDERVNSLLEQLKQLKEQTSELKRA